MTSVVCSTTLSLPLPYIRTHLLRDLIPAKPELLHGPGLLHPSRFVGAFLCPLSDFVGHSPLHHYVVSPYCFLSVTCPTLSIPGILDEKEAISVNKQVQARKLKGSGVSSPSPVKKAATVKKAGGEGRKRKSRLEDDVVVKTGLVEGGMEGVGSTAFA